MQEKELRLALVCYGGLSLAVYMHGVSKEFLKVSRASARFHDRAARRSGKGPRFDAAGGDRYPDRDTEAVYFDLLAEIGERLDLRVIVDTIAGTSAGGINGIMLARALAHDLSLDSHRAMWLDGADVTELMGEASAPAPWSKLYLRPFLWGLGRGDSLNAEARGKISAFVRARWWHPPFSGARFSGMLLDALKSMENHSATDANGHSSLVPAGHQLSLHVTLTNFHGYPRRIPLHDPPFIVEREHRHIMRFDYRENRSGDRHSDFSDSAIAGLAFAARATSSYAGLFEPARVAEVRAVAAARGIDWHDSEAFLRAKLPLAASNASSTEDMVFIDGGVLNNKPFDAALSTIRARAAHRQVDRRLINIEPVPETSIGEIPKRLPTFLRTVRAGFADLPRTEPILDELELLAEQNARSRRIRRIVESAQPKVDQLVADIAAESVTSLPATEAQTRVQLARNLSEKTARTEAGYAYSGYLRLRLEMLVERFNRRQVLGPLTPDQAEGLVDVLIAWAAARLPGPGGSDASSPATEDACLQEVLDQFDIDYRVRRLRYLVLRLNQLYPTTTSPAERPGTLDAFKARIYDEIGHLELDLETLRAWHDEHSASPSSSASERRATLDSIATALDLADADTRADDLILRMWDENRGVDDTEGICEALDHAYLAFTFFDTMSFPVARWSDLQELDEIKVVRLSSQDCTSLRDEPDRPLEGTRFYNFGAFFSREYRENDYLLGRIHAADRLVEVLLDAAPDFPRARGVLFKQRLFEAILASERAHLQAVLPLLDRLTARVADLTRQGG